MKRRLVITSITSRAKLFFMKIAILSPLYPPDVAELASYTKELVKRIRGKHTLTLLTYGHLPERIDDVTIVAVDKRSHILKRLFCYTIALRRLSGNVDLLYAQNGASVEFPLLLNSLLSRTPFVLRLGDSEAIKRTERSVMLRFIHHAVRRRAIEVIPHTGPLPKPEILPFTKVPVDMSAYEDSWTRHIDLLETTFSNEQS